jgi:hypothetical protein
VVIGVRSPKSTNEVSVVPAHEPDFGFAPRLDVVLAPLADDLPDSATPVASRPSRNSALPSWVQRSLAVTSRRDCVCGRSTTSTRAYDASPWYSTSYR